MTDAVGESLSALQDGEASELDLRRVLRELEQDDGLRQRWARNQLISSVIKQEPLSDSGFSLADRIREELSGEPVARVSTWRSMFKPVASVAVAATVTMGVLTGTQLYQQAVSVDAETPVLTEVASNQAPTTVFENFDNGAAPVAAGQFPELSLLASSTASQQRASSRRSCRRSSAGRIKTLAEPSTGASSPFTTTWRPRVCSSWSSSALIRLMTRSTACGHRKFSGFSSVSHPSSGGIGPAPCM